MHVVDHPRAQGAMPAAAPTGDTEGLVRVTAADPTAALGSAPEAGA